SVMTVLLCFGLTTLFGLLPFWILRFRLDYYLFEFFCVFGSTSCVRVFCCFKTRLHFVKLRFCGEKIKQTFDRNLCIWVLNSPLGKLWVTNPATLVRFPT